MSEITFIANNRWDFAEEWNSYLLIEPVGHDAVPTEGLAEEIATAHHLEADEDEGHHTDKLGREWSWSYEQDEPEDVYMDGGRGDWYQEEAEEAVVE